MGIATVIAAGGLLVAAPAGARPRVEANLHMSDDLRHHLGRLWERTYFGTRGHQRIERKSDAHYGRVENRYYALVCVYYDDLETKDTDCGAVFKKVGRQGEWRVLEWDGGYDCTRGIPRVLRRYWTPFSC
ncbi:hypothetical protein [Spirillospora albida]|uniref:hypothetical protein n=1 Tax=Spirillospora albida TaxID=58123 RepID=UPI0004BF19EE|nr:hypothetical protein [Spirillospora albida]